MADTGHIAIEGFKAGAIKYVVLEGFVPNPLSFTLNACIVTMGFGIANTHKVALLGFVPGTFTPTSARAFYIFGESVVR
jgi:hypothetical protein